MPSFAKILHILSLRTDNSFYFVSEFYLTDCFNHHYHSYEAVPTGEIMVIKQQNLIDYHVLHQYKINFNNFFILLKYHILEFL